MMKWLIGATLALAGAAQAQTVGTYSGTQANGSSINLTVGTDPNTGAPQINSFGLSITGPCKPTGTINTGWGFNPSADFMGNKVSFTYAFDYLLVNFTGTASGNTISGTVTSYTPTFAAYTKTPKKSVLCTVPKQSYSVTLQAAASARPGTRYIERH